MNTREQECHLFLDVLNQEGRRAQVVHGEVEEALDLLLMQVHGDDVRQPCTRTETESSKHTDKRAHTPQLIAAFS